MTSLRRHAQANAPGASYWLRRVLDDRKRPDWTSPSCEGCRGRSLQCTVALFERENWTRDVTGNVALKKAAVQSSTWSTAEASLAVDGSLSTGACTRRTSLESWWSVDLGGPMDVGRVCIINDASPTYGQLSTCAMLRYRGTSYGPVSVSVGLSVCHKPALCRYEWTNRAGFFCHKGFLRVYTALLRNSGISGIGVFPARTLSGTLQLANFAAVRRSCCQPKTLTVELVCCLYLLCFQTSATCRDACISTCG